MASPRPALSELDRQYRTSLASRLEGTDPLLRRSYVAAFGRVHAAVAHGLYGRIEYAENQNFPGSADIDSLEVRHASIKGMARKGGEAAIGLMLVTGEDGAVIEAGVIVSRSDGVTFSVDEDAVIAEGVASVSITAVEASSNANTPAGATLSFVSPLENVDSTATVAEGGLAAGADVEAVEELRGRVKERWRKPPQGGARHDYIAWAKEIPGIKRAWCALEECGAGTVTVRYVLDGEEDIFPDAAHVAMVKEYIQAKHKVIGDLYVFSPIAEYHDFNIQLSPNTPAVQAAVRAELNDLIFREATPGATIFLSKIREAVSAAAGEGNNVVVSPVADLEHGNGRMAQINNIAFSEIA